ALQGQRLQSQEERRSRHIGVAVDELSDLSRWDVASGAEPEARFVGYDVVEITTEVTALRRLDGNRVAMLLRESPFYAESGGQVSDHGEIVGDGWRMDVEDVKKVSGRPAAVGTLEGEFRFGTVVARVPNDQRRDTERNHTATHLLHAALRAVLGEHVHQAGSLVSPDKLRFDFTHHGPLRPEQLAAVEEWVNDGIWRDVPLRLEERPYQEAVQMGAMALFGEKYGDVVRVVAIPGLSMELCGGTHVRGTGQIGLFKITVESGVAAGVRRIEGLTGRRAYEFLRDRNRMVVELAEMLRAPVEQLPRRVRAVLDDRRTLEKKLDEAVRADGGGNQVRTMLDEARDVGGVRVVARYVPSADAKMLQTLGDALREQLQSGVAVLGTAGDDRGALLAVVSDDVRDRGLRADMLVRAVAETVGGRGGGKAHMAQAGIPDPTQVSVALEGVPAVVERLLAGMK
ncbi:MAG: DHHA1 domain-containing protein, partial [Gemmatimonadaceae bacterium]